MNNILKRCLAWMLVVSLLLSNGMTSVFAASGSTANAPAADVAGAILAEPSEEREMIQNALTDAMDQIEGFDADAIVTFLVELEGTSLLDTKPASLTMGQYMATSDGIAAAARIDGEQAAVQSLMSMARNNVLSIDYTYQVVMNGMAVTGPWSMKAELEALPGVASVTVANTYEVPQAQHVSGTMMGSDMANASGYTGKGTVTAILDTGLDVAHEAFSNAPEAPAMDLEDIQDLVAAGGLNANVTAEELYKNEKVPFAFDYADNDADVSDYIDHGTHVAGSVGGDCEAFSGVAPDTQLVILKVFSDEGGGATDAIIFAALEDAVLLGVDAINMSLGTPGGFTSENELTTAVYESIRRAGINLMVSAGNETDATSNTNLGTNLPLISEPDNGIVGSPSTYPASLSVASVNEYQDYVTYLLSGELQLSYTDGNMETAMDFVKTFDGQTLEYVPVGGFGTADDFAAVDVTGKIALVARGDLAFTEKEQNAYNAGAVGMIVHDNVEGDKIYMQGGGLIPMIFISRADGLALREQENKTISVSVDYKTFVDVSDGGLMSGFSSLGVAPDMTLKPEITAPGGYVYSTLPGGTYGSMSGTSMASPHMAGASAVMRQYVNETYPQLSETEKQELINTLLMNTAVPVEDENGVAYTPRKQGAGLAQVNSAIETGAYVTVDGSDRPKAQLGDSAEGYFSKEVTLTVHNLTDAELTYTMSAIPLTAMEETVVVNGVKYLCISDNARIMPEEEFQVLFSQDSVTVPANGTASVTVKLRLTQAGEDALSNFVNGTFLDGFIVLEAGNDGIDLSVPYLGFYGDWGQPAVFDDTVYDDETASVYPGAMALLDLYTGGGIYLGSNLYTDGESYDVNKIAVSKEMLASGYRPFTMLGLLRGPKSLTYTVTDAEGNAIELLDELTLESLGDSYTVENVIKSFYYSSGGYVNYEMGPTYNGWMPAQDFGDGFYGWLDDGNYTIHVEAQVDGTDSEAGKQSLSFPITIDSQAPQVLGTDFEEVDGVPYVTIDLYDNHYVMAFQLVSADGLMTFSPIIPVDETEPGTTSSFTFDTSGLLAAGYTSAVAIVYDYAMNGYASYEFSLESDTLQPAGVFINNQGLTCSGQQTFEIEAWIEPEGLEETGLVWTSSDENVATVRDTGKTRYDKDSNVTFYIAEVTTKNVTGDATITVSTVNGKTASTTVRVVADFDVMPEDYVIREDGTYQLPADLHKTTVTITDNARDVGIVGANTADAPYNDLYIKSEITEGLNLTIRDLNVTNTISSSWGTPKAQPVITFVGKDNVLTLEGENTLVGVQSGSMALIEVNNDAALTVEGTGKLNLTLPAYSSGAGIGNSSGYDSVTYQSYTCGSITIADGHLNIRAEGYGAGIGGGAGSAGGTIVIDGGVIDIEVIGYGAGIGGGSGGGAPSITINDGIVNVDVLYAMAGYSYNQNYAGAGIGSGNGNSGGATNITVNGGEITATTATNSAAIGGALYSTWGKGTDAVTVTINDGKVTASSLDEGGTTSGGGAAIGSAYMGGTANITVNGGQVIALTETAAAAIGGGYSSGVPTVTVKGGTVSALANSANSSSAYRGPAIGKGAYGTAGVVTIDAGAVLAVGNADSNLVATSIINSSYDSLVEVTLNIPNVESLMIDGVDWKVSANHADFTQMGGSDHTGEVHVWLPATTDTPYIVSSGEDQFELWSNGSAFEFHSVTYDLTGLVTDGPAKVYDPSAGEGYSADLTGILALESRTTMQLPAAITVTVDGEEVAVDYNAETGAFTVAAELLTGDVVVTAAAVEVVDKTALNELIAQAETMDEDLYTGSSWTALQAALADAKAVAGADPTTQAAIDQAYSALLAAMEALVTRADASALEELIAEAEKMTEAQYVSTTWPAFAEALAEAKVIAADSNATAEEIQATIDALQTAMDALVLRGDKTQLRSLIDEADVLFETNYTPESWADSDLEAALEAAIEVYIDPDATQEEVDAAAQALKKALDTLLERSDFSVLLAMIEKAEALNAADYTENSWAALEAALTAGKTIAEDLNALQTDIDAAAAALEAAIADLVARGDTTALEEAIAEAEGLTGEDYTPETWAPLEEAVEAAKETAADPNADQEAVDAALEALEEALAGLTKRANTSALAELIVQAEALDGEDYTRDTWAAVEAALTEAKTLIEDLNASQEAVDAAADKLAQAMANLSEEADKSALQALYDVCAVLVETAYTAESWLGMDEAIAHAAAVLADPNASQAEVDAAADALRTAAAALVRAGDARALQSLLDAAEEALDDYTDASAQVIAQAMEAAEQAIAVRAEQTVLDAAYVALAEALRNGEEHTDHNAVCPSAPFTDVESNSWYHEAVDYMVLNGYMVGVSEALLGTEQNMTRAQLVTILYRLAEEPSVDGLEHPFRDVAAGSWYADAITWAYHAEVVNGVSETAFAPDAPISREQVATIVYRFVGEPEVSEDLLSAFGDSALVSSYAANAMNWAVANGLIQGVPAGDSLNLQPQDNTTRAQIAVILYRFLTK